MEIHGAWSRPGMQPAKAFRPYLAAENGTNNNNQRFGMETKEHDTNYQSEFKQKKQRPQLVGNWLKK